LGLPGSMRRSKMLDELNFGDACKFISADAAADQNLNRMVQRNCSKIGKGVLHGGLNAGVQLYMQMGNTFNTITEATKGIANPAQLYASLTTPEYDTTVALLIWWLPAGMRIETRIYYDEQVDNLAHFVSLRTTMLAVFLSALALIFVLVFEPLVYEMDMHVKRVRALLVMIPAEIAMSTASLRNALLSAV